MPSTQHVSFIVLPKFIEIKSDELALAWKPNPPALIICLLQQGSRPKEQNSLRGACRCGKCHVPTTSRIFVYTILRTFSYLLITPYQIQHSNPSPISGRYGNQSWTHRPGGGSSGPVRGGRSANLFRDVSNLAHSYNGHNYTKRFLSASYAQCPSSLSL